MASDNSKHIMSYKYKQLMTYKIELIVLSQIKRLLHSTPRAD